MSLFSRVRGSNSRRRCDVQRHQSTCEALEDRKLLAITFSPGISISGPGLTPLSVADDPQGDSYIVGTYNGTTNFDPNPTDTPQTLTTFTGTTSGFVAKYSPEGALVWVHGFEATNALSGLYQDSLDVDAAGNVYVAGAFYGAVNFDPSASGFTYSTGAASPTAAFILELSSTGAFNASLFHVFTTTTNFSEFSSVSIDPSGQFVYVAGDYSGTGTYSGQSSTITTASTSDSFLLKLNANLSYVWGATAGSTDASSPSVGADANGNVYLTSHEYTTSNLILLQKFSSGGSLLAKDEFGLAAEASLGDIAVDSAGDVYMTGSFYGVLSISFGQTINLTNEGGSNPMTSNSDGFVAKFNSSLSIVWANEFGSTDSDQGSAIALDSANNVYVGGFVFGNAHYGQTTGAGVLIPSPDPLGIEDALVIKLDSNGNYLDSAVSESPTGSPEIDSLAVSRYGEVTALGDSDSALTFGGKSYPSGSGSNSVLFVGQSLYAPSLVSDSQVVLVVGKPHHFKKFKADRLFFSAFLTPQSAQVKRNFHVTQMRGSKMVKVQVTKAIYNSSSDSVDLVLGSYKRNKPLTLTASGLMGVNGLSVPTYTTLL